MRENTATLPKFNRGRPLRIFRNNGIVYTVDYDTTRVWKEYELESVVYHNWRDEEEVHLAPPPPHYAKEVSKDAGIGGVGVTLRYVGLYKAHIDAKRKAQFTEVFATNILNKDAFLETMELVKNYVTVGDFDDQEDGYGTAVDLVCDLEHLEVVCAQIANTGANILLDDLNVNSFECVGIERLDRREEYPRRAAENWRYSFIPSHWQVLPLKWENMAENVCNYDDVTKLPQPLQQHVVQLKLRCSQSSTEREFLRCLVPHKRWVSGALSIPQSRQLINAFYKMYVEQTPDPIERDVAKIIMWQYLVRRGMTARWLGKYNQSTLYLGNGINIRKFKKLKQYDPSRLSIPVLNNIYKKGGKFKGKGNKGSRSKYAKSGEKYTPKRRMKRPTDWQERMMANPLIDTKDGEDEWE